MYLLKCILCFKEIEKDYERFLVQSKKTTTIFDVNIALANVEFDVHVTSEYICRQCYGILKKRSNLQQNLENLEKSMRWIDMFEGSWACFSAEKFVRTREFEFEGLDSKATASPPLFIFDWK